MPIMITCLPIIAADIEYPKGRYEHLSVYLVTINQGLCDKSHQQVAWQTNCLFHDRMLTSASASSLPLVMMKMSQEILIINGLEVLGLYNIRVRSYEEQKIKYILVLFEWKKQWVGSNVLKLITTCPYKKTDSFYTSTHPANIYMVMICHTCWIKFLKSE